MLSLLIDPYELLLDQALQPQTRQAKRAEIRAKEIKASKLKKLNQAIPDPNAPESTSKKEREKTARKEKRREERTRRVDFGDHSYQVADMIVRIADDLERCTDEEKQWFEDGIPGLIASLATEHNVVDKYRPVDLKTSIYERRVIEAALAICKLDNLLEIEECLGFVRLRVLRKPEYWYSNITRLRSAA